jgi:hypothetical protein
MNFSTRSRLAEITAAVAVLVGGCVFQHEDQLDTNGNEVDFHSFGGVSIVGERTYGDSTDPAGPLPLDELQTGWFSA